MSKSREPSIFDGVRCPQTKLAELEAKCLSYTLALQRADQQQAADRSMIASLSQSCSKLRAEVGRATKQEAGCQIAA